MEELARSKETITRREVSKAEALDTYTKKGDEYKVELISALEDGTISFYTNGNFTDLCRGPHLQMCIRDRDWTDKIFINLIQPTGDFFTFVKCRLCPAGCFCGHSDLPSFLCSVRENAGRPRLMDG